MIYYINGSSQDCSNSVTNALDLLQHCAYRYVYIFFTGNQAGDQVIYTLLSTGPMIGGVIAILLDNILPGMYLHTPLTKASYFSLTVSNVRSASLQRRHMSVKLSEITANLTSVNSFFMQTTKKASTIRITVPLWGESIGYWFISLTKGQ